MPPEIGDNFVIFATKSKDHTYLFLAQFAALWISDWFLDLRHEVVVDTEHSGSVTAMFGFALLSGREGKKQTIY